MKKIIRNAVVILVVLAFTPLGFTLMPLIALLAIIGGIYWISTGWMKHHHI